MDVYPILLEFIVLFLFWMLLYLTLGAGAQFWGTGKTAEP